MIRVSRKSDVPGLVSCMRELQEHERRIESDRRPGARMARPYVKWLVGEALRCRGRIFVADVGGRVAGFVAVWPLIDREPRLVVQRRSAYISDLVVLAAHRRRGIARALMERAERFARARGVRQVLLGVLERNRGARGLYRALGYGAYARYLRKSIATD